jgi:DNA-binding response OmpR family regulator
MRQKPYIVILDDDTVVAKLIAKAVKLEAKHFCDAVSLMNDLKSLSPAAAFIDIHLGISGSGLDIIPFLRAHWPFTPILVITSDPTSLALSEAFAAGSNDFIRKPINAMELVARLHIRMEEQGEKRTSTLFNVGNVSLNRAQKVLDVAGSQIHLSTMDTNILYTLMRYKGTLVTRKTLMRRGWPGLAVANSSLEKKICELRAVLKESGTNLEIETIYSRGYRLGIRNRLTKAAA